MRNIKYYIGFIRTLSHFLQVFLWNLPVAYAEVAIIWIFEHWVRADAVLVNPVASVPCNHVFCDSRIWYTPILVIVSFAVPDPFNTHPFVVKWNYR
jgi:hypothetical protein